MRKEEKEEEFPGKRKEIGFYVHTQLTIRAGQNIKGNQT